MNSLWDRLETLRAIVDTARAEDLEQQPEAVRTRYEPYAEAYFVIEAVRRLEQKLIEELRAGRSVTGYLSADFGYGKTATAIYLWKRCLDSNIVAVPPFLFRQLKDLMWATKGWLAYQIRQTQPALLPELEEAYRRRAERSSEELAADIAREQGVSPGKALAIVREYIAGRRDLTTTSFLLEFWREAAELAQRAGFKGLIVFADELQEFVRSEESSREPIQTLSELVKGVRAMANVPLALMLAMPVEPTEAAIQEQADDIMQRMRERGTSLPLQDAYGREFPRELWKHLCGAFGNGGAQGAVEERTLEALGQLCERKDLSNGPRTVMSAFKRIAQQYQERRRAYTPMDLIDDYLQGHLVFEGRGTKLTNSVRRMLEHPAVQGQPQRQQVMKLMAAFPRGVDAGKGGDLYDVLVGFAEGLLGEYLTQLSEGYALVGLQEREGPRPLLDEIIRDFRRRWYQAYSTHQKEGLAATGFFREILPLLLPSRGQGQNANFGGYRDADHDTRGVAYLTLEGSYERLLAQYPNRRVCVSVSTSPQSLVRFEPPEGEIDLDLRFFLEFPPDDDADAVPARLESANQDRRVDFHLNLKRPFGHQFPAELGFLRDIIAPERTSASVLLGLSMRMWGWLQDHPDTSQADRQMIEAQRRSLHRFALQLLLPDAGDPSHVQVLGLRVSGAGQKLVESVFEAKCAELYPDYRSLMVTSHWKTQLRRYRDVLGRRPLAERRGRQPFQGTKQEIAQIFGYRASSFESESRSLKEMGLLELQDWGGRGDQSQASVLFFEHPLEAFLREALRDEGRVQTVEVGGRAKRIKALEISRLRELGRRRGYLADEVDEALELLRLRQYVEPQPDGTVREYAGTLDAEELGHQAEVLEQQLQRLSPYYRSELRTQDRLVREARERLAGSVDEVALDAAQRALQSARDRLETFIETQAHQLRERLERDLREVERRQGELEPRELEAQVTGAVDFVRHVDDQRKALGRQFQKLRQDWQQFGARLGQVKQSAGDAGNAEQLCEAEDQHRRLQAQREELEEALQRLRPYLAGLQNWRTIVAQATGLRDRLEPDTPLRRRLDEELTTAVMENFAQRRMEALLDWERYKPDFEAVQAEIQAEESREREAFSRLKEQYEQALSPIVPQRMIQAPFDPRDREQSYRVLYQGVLAKLKEWLGEQQEEARRTRDELDHLIQERGIQASEERAEADSVVQACASASQRLNEELVRGLDAFQQYCTELGAILERQREVHRRLVNLRMAKEEPTDEEKPLLRALSTQRRSLEDLRRQMGAGGRTLDDLFERLKSLHRKGHIEIEVRRRE